MVSELSQSTVERGGHGAVRTVFLQTHNTVFYLYGFRGVTAPSGPRPTLISRLHDHSQTYHTQQYSSGRVISPAQTTDLTTLNTHKRQTSIHRVGFEPAISASELPQFDRAVTGTIIPTTGTRDMYNSIAY
jgi:hypothetical protein